MNRNILVKAERVAELLSCIAHPLRLLMICLLLKREMFVNEFIKALGTTKGNISQHLRVLSAKGLIRGRRAGNRIFYSIKDPDLASLIARVKELYCPDLAEKGRTYHDKQN